MLLAKFLERDRIRRGFTVGQFAWRLGLTPPEYRALIPGEVEMTRYATWERYRDLVGLPATYAATRR